MIKILCQWMAVVLATPVAYGATTATTTGLNVPNYQIYQPYVSPRALGMGNAFTAVADDYAALFYNPAGMARRKDGNLNLAITAGIDAKAQAFYTKVNDAIGTNTSTNDLTQLISENYGKHYWARTAPLAAAYVRPGWGFAIIPADVSADLAIHQAVGPAVDAIAINDTTIAIGFAKNLKNTGDHIVSIGMTIKPMYRAYYAQTLLATQIALNQDIFNPDQVQEGATVDIDLGTLWTPPAEDGFLSYIKPSFALVVRNAADYGFPFKTHSISSLGESPPKLERRIDIGTRFELPGWWVFKPNLMIDERDMLARNYTFLKGSHVGLEFNWFVRSWLHGGYRAGLNQGYWTAGVSANLGIFMLDVASWGEEVGTTKAKLENRRYMARASLDF